MADQGRRRTRSRTLKIDHPEIVDRVVSFFEKDNTDRSAEKEARIQRYAKYRMWVEGKDFPWPDASDVPLPDMMEKSLRMQDTLHNAVMSSRPVVGAKALDKADNDKAEVVDRLIDFQVFVEQRGEEFVGDMADAFINDGLFVVFTPWVKEERETSDIKHFVEPIPDDPDGTELIAQHRHPLAVGRGYFCVDQELGELLGSRSTERPEPVAAASASHDERRPHAVEVDPFLAWDDTAFSAFRFGDLGRGHLRLDLHATHGKVGDAGHVNGDFGGDRLARLVGGQSQHESVVQLRRGHASGQLHLLAAARVGHQIEDGL